MNAASYIKKLLRFNKYRNGEYVELLKSWLWNEYSKNTENDPGVFLYENARTGEYEFLKSLNLPACSNVIIQGFTCNAVVNPILWLGLEPRYVDIEADTLNIDISDLQKKIDENTKVIIVQHTFGNPAKIEKILNIAKLHNIVVLEDCAHCLGITNHRGEKLLGTYGDASIVSFGIEKILDTRVGGALIVNNSRLIPVVEKAYNEIGVMSIRRTLMWLLNPLMWLGINLFGSKKMSAAKVLRNWGMINMGFELSELEGVKPDVYPVKLSNVLAQNILEELDSLSNNLGHREKIAKVYRKGLDDFGNGERSFILRYPIILKNVKQKNDLYNELIALGVTVGNWYDPHIYPASTNIESMLYKPGECNVAEDVSHNILNLPTGFAISEELASRVVELVKHYEH